VTPLFLIGFMAAGKTTVGRALAGTNRRFIDLDDAIDVTGETVAELVARDEAEFRRREATALARVIAEANDGAVIATGGGAATYGDNLARMRAAGCVVALGVDVDEALRRAANGPSRPLLANAEVLARQRAPIYRRAHAVVETTGRSLAEVTGDVQRVERAWRPDAAAIVALGARSYAITVNDRWQLPVTTATRVAVITDRNLERDQLAALASHLPPHEVYTIEPGEASKTFATFEHLCEQLVAQGLDRESLVVALGGGVVGDLAGFVAASVYRGVTVWQLPTTIVAMTDAAIGGKTAIDLPAGKNLVGAFWQPAHVACNLATLATLPARERKAGFGELWKYGLLDGEDLFRTIDACTTWARDGGALPEPLHEVIARSIAYKAAIVGRDEREQTGHRALLNLGHTVGHAIESQYGLHHGEAVALGLVVAARVSAALGLAPTTLETVIAEALLRTGLPADPSPYLSDATIERIKVDKKRVGDQVRFIAMRGVGACEPVAISVAELGRILRAAPAT
jgi:shikimate kinase/3-dehydroquinate synthase